MSRKTKQKITDENVHSDVSKTSPNSEQETSSDLRIKAEKYLENRLFQPDSTSGLDRGEIQGLLHELVLCNHNSFTLAPGFVMTKLWKEESTPCP